MPSPELVDQVKALQRSSPESKQAWWDHCDQELGGVRDPNRHDDATLEAFLAAMGQGAAPSGRPSRPSAMQRPSFSGKGPSKGGYGPPAFVPGPGGGYGPPAYGPGPGPGFGPPMMGGGGGAPPDLANWVKIGQKSSRAFKDGWATYCQMYGGSLNDPAKHDPTYISEFINYVGQLVMENLQAQQMQAQQMYMPPPMMAGPPVGAMPGAKRRMAESFSEPPRKRAAPPRQSAGGDGDAEKAELVDQIKALQRQDKSAKEAWWQYTDDNHGGVHDPNRHDKEVLREFLNNYA